jgi:hypothetical protein
MSNHRRMPGREVDADQLKAAQLPSDVLGCRLARAGHDIPVAMPRPFADQVEGPSVANDRQSPGLQLDRLDRQRQQRLQSSGHCRPISHVRILSRKTAESPTRAGMPMCALGGDFSTWCRADSAA